MSGAGREESFHLATKEANPLSRPSILLLQINFMYFHAGRVIRTDGWQSLLASCPEIANSVVRRLSEFHDESVSAREEFISHIFLFELGFGPDFIKFDRVSYIILGKFVEF